MSDAPQRVAFASPAAFLVEAQRLVREDRVVWRKEHQSAHVIEKHEAEYAVLYATTATPDPQWAGRYRVQGRRRSGDNFLVVASVVDVPGEGRWLFVVSAFERWRK